jgi:hypothetical protein
MAARLPVTERSAHGIVNDLTAAGYISKHKDDRRNRDQIVAHQSLPEPITREKIFAAGMRSGHVSHQAACSAST